MTKQINQIKKKEPSQEILSPFFCLFVCLLLKQLNEKQKQIQKVLIHNSLSIFLYHHHHRHRQFFSREKLRHFTFEFSKNSKMVNIRLSFHEFRLNYLTVTTLFGFFLLLGGGLEFFFLVNFKKSKNTQKYTNTDISLSNSSKFKQTQKKCIHFFEMLFFCLFDVFFSSCHIHAPLAREREMTK